MPWCLACICVSLPARGAEARRGIAASLPTDQLANEMWCPICPSSPRPTSEKLRRLTVVSTPPMRPVTRSRMPPMMAVTCQGVRVCAWGWGAWGRGITRAGARPHTRKFSCALCKVSAPVHGGLQQPGRLQAAPAQTRPIRVTARAKPCPPTRPPARPPHPTAAGKPPPTAQAAHPPPAGTRSPPRC